MENNSKYSAASALGASKSPAKAAASRENGKRGGRPALLTGGKRGFVVAVNEAFTTTANAPTVRYSHRRGFHTESGRHPTDNDVIWSKLAGHTNGGRSIRPADYSEVREQILEAESK